MQGICINTGSTTVLREGQKYFLFDHGPNNFYVSKFDNVNAHMGSYRKTHFELVEDQQPAQDESFEHPGELLDDGRVIYHFENPDIEPIIEQPQTYKLKRYVAQVAKYRNGYRIGDLFIISEKEANGYYHVYLKDRPAGGPVGSYITNFFEIITEYDEIEKKIKGVQTPERPKIEAQPIEAAIPLQEPEKPKIESQAKPGKQKKQKGVPDGQMDIFDFLMEG
jgi:hypothetical protein